MQGEPLNLVVAVSGTARRKQSIPGPRILYFPPRFPVLELSIWQRSEPVRSKQPRVFLNLRWGVDTDLITDRTAQSILRPSVNADGSSTFRLVAEPGKPFSATGSYSGPQTGGRNTIRLLSGEVSLNPICDVGKLITGSVKASFQQDDGSYLDVVGEFSMTRTY
jgi:hypothetical protein